MATAPYKTKDGLWNVMIELPSDSTGKRRRKKVSATTRAALEEKLQHQSAAATFRHYSNLYIDGARTDSTRKKRIWQLKQPLLEFGEMSVDRITVDKVEELLRSLAHLRSVDETKFAIGAVLRLAEGRGDVARNVGRLARLPHREKRKTNRIALTEEQVLQLITHAFDTEHRLRWFITTAWETGARPHELRLLRWEDIDFENRTIHFHRDPKTPKSVRVLSMTDLCFCILAFYAEEITPTPRESVFPKLDKDNLRRDLRKLSKAAGIPSITTYDLRHSAATHLAKTLTVVELQQVLGHADTRTLSTYLHADAVIQIPGYDLSASPTVQSLSLRTIEKLQARSGGGRHQK